MAGLMSQEAPADPPPPTAPCAICALWPALNPELSGLPRSLIEKVIAVAVNHQHPDVTRLVINVLSA